MNLDDFKIQLNKELEGNESFNMEVGGITQLHTTKTNSIADKILRSLNTEIIFSILFLVVFALVVCTSNLNSVRIYFSVFTVLVFAFTLLLFYLSLQTKKLASSSLTVIANLKTLHKILTEFCKRYFQFTMLLIPVCFVFGAYLSFQEAHINWDEHLVEHLLADNKKLLVVFAIAIVAFAVGMYYFTKWYLKKLYGNHLSELKKMIEQLEA